MREFSLFHVSIPTSTSRESDVGRVCSVKRGSLAVALDLARKLFTLSTEVNDRQLKFELAPPIQFYFAGNRYATEHLLWTEAYALTIPAFGQLFFMSEQEAS